MRLLDKNCVAAAALAMAFCTPPAMAAGPKPVYRVDYISVSAEGGKVSVEAHGAVRTGGWSDPRLVVKSWGTTTIVLELRATPPGTDEVVIQALMPVSASTTLRVPASASAIQVISETNNVSQPIAK